MINANELRIGNWVSCTAEGLDYGIKVDGISRDAICVSGNDWFGEKYVNPIPLTPELLEKAGFEEFEFHFICHECVRLKVNEIWYKKSAPNVKATVLHYQIKHLHQLQNLIFALTGEELNITL